MKTNKNHAEKKQKLRAIAISSFDWLTVVPWTVSREVATCLMPDNRWKRCVGEVEMKCGFSPVVC
jgi:hypothetical protein